MDKRSLLYKASFCLLLISLSLINNACSEDDPPVTPPPEIETPFTVRVLFASGGLSNLAYNDTIFRRILEQQQKDSFLLECITPHDNSEAERFLRQWQADDNGGHYLTILAASEYEELARKQMSPAAASNSLIFDTRAAGLAIPSFHFTGYGVSFLVGITAYAQTGDEKAAYIGAQQNEAFIEECYDGFRDGYLYAGGKEVVANYLSTTKDGFDMPREAYKMANELYKRYPFIYIMAGNSNQGVYEYLRDYPDYKYTAGVDTDQSAYSTQIIGSTIKDAGSCVNQYITRWLKGEKLPMKEQFTLESGFMSFKIAGPYKQKLEKVISESMQIAIDKEKEYEKTKP
ncbi:MAG: BMP family protein [Parabacteroides sp.]|nr:BMP family protein [Parabacteroides sp.]